MSEVRLSEIQQKKNFRIDSEYYGKEYLSLESKLDNYETKTIFEICNQITDFGAFSQTNYIEFLNEGILFLRNQDVKESYINLSDNVFISDVVYNKLTLHLRENDILIPRVGTLGNAALITKEMLPCTANQNLAVIRLKEFNSYAVIMTLVSKIGKSQINRTSTGNVQQWLNLEAIGTLRIPNFSPDFQSQIEQIVKSAHAKLAESKSLYAEAEEILLSELGLKDWQPKKNSHTDSILLTQNQDEDTKTKRDSVGISNPCGNIANYSIKRFSDFASSGRLDAEYYQSKYDELEEKLSQFQLVKIKDIINYPVCSGSTPKAGDSQYYTDHKNGIPFLRAVDIIQSRVDMSDLLYIKSDVHNGLLNRTQLKKNDVLFSIAGTVGRCGIFDYDFEANINQAIAIIRFDESVVKHLYVIQFFNSKIGQLLIEKYARQGLQTNLNLEEVSNLYLPVISMEIQTLIAEKIQKSFDLRKQSQQLLESAKRMVEEEIEKQ